MQVATAKKLLVYVHPRAGLGDLICDVIVEDKTHYIVSPLSLLNATRNRSQSFHKVKKTDCRTYDEDENNGYPWVKVKGKFYLADY